MCINIFTLTIEIFGKNKIVDNIGRVINSIKMKYNNNKQCAEFDLGTAPWTSIYIII